jgi:peroxiredoxin
MVSPQVGAPAPDFTLTDHTGQPWTLSEHRGRNVLLVFYPLDFSPTCTGELRDLAALREKLGAAGAEVVGISVDSRWAHGAFRAAEHLEATLLADFQPRGAVAQLYGAYLEEPGIATRATFVIDAEGIVRWSVITDPGTARNPDEYLEALAACPV